MGLQLKAISSRSSVDQVVDRIREVITEQRLTAGQRLPGELELVEQLQVSRSVLREALARLQGLGLIEIKRGNGTFVASKDRLTNCVQLLCSAVTLSPRELLSYAELRAAIEVQAVRQAAERATDIDIAELKQLLQELNSIDRPYKELLEIDFQFHRRILQVAANELMQNLMEVIYEFVMAQMAQTTPSARDNKTGHRQHYEIVTAIEAHDVEAAERAMREHMEVVLQMLKNRSDVS
ncbi:MAG: FadR/GntR family transcriptional regulator [Pirellulales bacterium]